MSSTTEPLPSESAEEVRAALARAVSSEAFRNAPQLTAFLTFIVEKTLAGEAHGIKGYTIATQALGRGLGFDPQADPIVRVEAGRLRKALHAYYQDSGRADPLKIIVPRGSYVPRFERDPEEPAEAGEGGGAGAALVDAGFEEVPRPDPRPEPAPADSAAGGRRPWRWIAALGLLLALAAGALVLDRGGRAGSDFVLRPIRTKLFGADAEPADGRTLVLLGPVATEGRIPGEVAPSLLRSMILDALARFDEIVVVDGLAGRTRGEAAGYALNLRVSSSDGAVLAIVRLTRLPSGRVVWARSFDLLKNAEDGASPEAAVARQIATTVAQPYGVLFADLRGRAGTDARTRCMIASYDYWIAPTLQAHRQGRACLEAVVAEDPGAATAHANLAYFYLDEFRVGYNPRPGSLDRAFKAAHRALELAPQSPRAHQALMAVEFVRGNAEEAMRLGRRAMELNPYDTDILADVGARHVQIGRYREGADLIERAAAANPAGPPWYGFFRFLAAYMQGDLDKARAASAQIVSDDYVLGLVARAIMAGQDGDATRAQELLLRLVAVQPEFARNPRAALGKRRFAPEITERLIAGLRQAGLRT